MNPLQPHKGSSETAGSLCFDLLLVELQPHKGSSETNRPRRVPGTSRRFNPTRVRLKRRLICRRFTSALRFNPTRVRLKLEESALDGVNDYALQPHKGSSETIGGVQEERRREVGFNPTRVRLKQADRLRVTLGERASTPQGFV